MPRVGRGARASRPLLPLAGGLCPGIGDEEAAAYEQMGC